MRKFVWLWWLTGSLLALILAACSGGVPATEPTHPLPAPSDTPAGPAPAAETQPAPKPTFMVVETLAPVQTTEETMNPTPANAYIAGLVQQAQQDLASRLGASVESIELVKYEDVQWPDGSLGCPQPGMLYTQVMVDGYRILLQYKGQEYAYHGGGGRPPFLCENPQ